MTHQISARSTPVFTIGHSNRSLDGFIALLREHSVELVVDVRRLPGSDRYPHFNADSLERSLANHSINFARVPPLTGRRPVSTTVPFEVNGWWENRSFHNYADHALSTEFQEGLAELQRLGSEHRTVVMCAEAVWWRCHRRIISDHLIASSTPVSHVLGPGQFEEARMSEGAQLGPGGRVVYPARRE